MGKQKENAPELSSTAPSNVPVMLRIGGWKTAFPEEAGEILIAEALNATVTTTGFHHALPGYLITRRRVCLVLYLEKKRMQSFLQLFYEEVRKQLRHRAEQLPHQLSLPLYEGELFHPLPAVHPWLVQLLLGQPVVLPYYSPHLARLEDHLRNYRFSSALDYTGAKSPVLVALQKHFF